MVPIIMITARGEDFTKLSSDLLGEVLVCAYKDCGFATKKCKILENFYCLECLLCIIIGDRKLIFPFFQMLDGARRHPGAEIFTSEKEKKRG